MTDGRRLLLLALARTSIRYMALRCRVTEAAIYHWSAGHNRPGPRARRALEKNYEIPTGSWFTYQSR